MEDKRPGRFAGSKVSQIANIFQSMAPGKEDGVLLVGGARTPDSPKLSRKDDPFRELSKEPVTVTVVRTESHVARFNNARAMFEKLGEENQKVHLRSPGSITPKSLTDRRSRSSSANSSDGNSTSPSRNKQISSRSPSPSYQSNRNSLTNGHDGFNHLANNKIANRLDAPKQNYLSKEINKGKENECNLFEPCKAAVLKNCLENKKKIDLEKPEKPEKPERKINNLIEKQRNWPSHFSNRRSTSKISNENRNNVGETKTTIINSVVNRVSAVTKNNNNKIGSEPTYSVPASKLCSSPLSPNSHVPYPPISPSPSMMMMMMSSQEEKQEKEVQEKVCLSMGKSHISILSTFSLVHASIFYIRIHVAR